MIAAGPPMTLPSGAGARPPGHLDERREVEEIGLGDRRDEQRVLARDGEADVGPLELSQARPLVHPQPVHRGNSRSAPAVARRSRCV